jgi:hypothetical protein
MLSHTIRTKTMAEFCLRMLLEVFLNGDPGIIFFTDFLAKAANGQKASQYFDLLHEDPSLGFPVDKQNNK